MDKEKILGIDISHWRRVDWRALPEKVKVVMIKATEGDYFVDDQFQSHVENALQAGKIVGLYHFYRTSRNGGKVDPAAQAEFFLHHTRQYWGDIRLRANDWERSHRLANGRWYNPVLGSELEDFYEFHQRLHRSDWAAFTLVYTNLATWQAWKMENWKNGWQGPAWIKNEPLIDGLWVAAWGVAEPSRLPRPFDEYWMHQFSANYLIPGITTAKGKPSGVDANWIPHSLEEIKGQLGFPGTNPEIPEDDTEEVLRIYRRGWQERTDSLIEYLQQSRDGGQG
jgi:hypothetical protein